MKEKILKIILVLLIIVTIIISIFVVIKKNLNVSEINQVTEATDSDSKMVKFERQVEDQVIDNYEFKFARLYYDNDKSIFLVNINKNQDDNKKLISIKISFVDVNNELLSSVAVPNVEYISYPFMYSTTIDEDLRNTKSIKYELEYEE